MGTFYTGPFNDNSLGDPGNICDGLSVQTIDGIQKGPGYDVVPWTNPQSQYGMGCNITPILHSTITEIKYGYPVRLKPYTPPAPVYNRSIVSVYRPGTMPADVGGFYTDWTNISSYKGSVYSSETVINETELYVYTKTTIINTQHIYISYSGTDAVCPPGTVYNSVTGTCDVLPGYEWDSGSGSYIEIVPLPELPTGIGHPPTYPPNEDLNCPPCYIYDAELNLCVYNPLEAGCEDLPINCVPIGGCVIPLSVVLEPIDLDKLLPPGYLESGRLPLQPTGAPLESVVLPIEPTVGPLTGECIILNECE